MKQGLSVMVGIPTMTNRITIQIAALMDELRSACFDSDAPFQFRYTMAHGKTPVEYARNVIVGTFLRSECDRLWFIDEDMLPESSAVRLLGSDADIICARMYKFDHENPETGMNTGLGLCAMQKKSNGFYCQINPSNGQKAIQDVDAVGTGCTIIRRHVLEDRRLWLENTYTTIDGKTIDGNVNPEKGEWAPALFRTQRAPNGVALMGEDVDFCQRAKELGYSIKVDLNAVSGHYKTIDINQTANLAQNTVERVLRGIADKDGNVVEYVPKHLQKPVMDRMMRADDVTAKAL